MSTLHLILLILAFLCEAFAVGNFVSGENRLRVIALGWACFFLSLIPLPS